MEARDASCDLVEDRGWREMRREGYAALNSYRSSAEALFSVSSEPPDQRPTRATFCIHP